MKYMIMIMIVAVLIAAAIEGKSIKDCVQLGNTLETCKRVNGVR